MKNICEFEGALDKIKWDIVGISEVRKQGRVEKDKKFGWGCVGAHNHSF